MLIIKMLKKKDPDNTFVKLWENKMCYHEVTHKYDIILI